MSSQTAQQVSQPQVPPPVPPPPKEYIGTPKPVPIPSVNDSRGLPPGRPELPPKQSASPMAPYQNPTPSSRGPPVPPLPPGLVGQHRDLTSPPVLSQARVMYDQSIQQPPTAA